NRLISGWQMGGIFQYHTGVPLLLQVGWNSAFNDGASGPNGSGQRPNLVANCNQILGTVAHWLNPACYTMPAIGELGNAGRFQVFSPDSNTFDWSLVKNTSINEKFNVQFRAEFFNLFNRVNFRPPGTPVAPQFQQSAAGPTAT